MKLFRNKYHDDPMYVRGYSTDYYSEATKADIRAAADACGLTAEVKAEALEEALYWIAPVDDKTVCGDFEQGLQWCARLLKTQIAKLRGGDK